MLIIGMVALGFILMIVPLFATILNNPFEQTLNILFYVVGVLVICTALILLFIRKGMESEMAKEGKDYEENKGQKGKKMEMRNTLIIILLIAVSALFFVLIMEWLGYWDIIPNFP
jgi:uncharacterized membrane protein